MTTWLAKAGSGLGFLPVLLAVAALLLPFAAVRADVTDAGGGPVRIVAYNVCGAWRGDPARPDDLGCRSPYRLAEWTGVIEREVDAWDTDVAMFQELCAGQWESLRRRLPGFQPVWLTTKPYAQGCEAWSGNGDLRFGMGVFVRTSQPVRPLTAIVTPQVAVPLGGELRGVLCARGPVDGRTTLACTTHLAPANYGPDFGAGQVLAHVGRWSAGGPVILGGDFNATPDAAVMDRVYAGTAATGRLAEMDGTDRDYFRAECLEAGRTDCRSGEPTAPGQRTKIDYIFVSARDFRTVRGEAIETALTAVRPDHLLLRAAATPG